MNTLSLRCRTSLLLATLALGVLCLVSFSARAQIAGETSSSPGMPAGYTLVASSDDGKKLVTHKTGPATLLAYLQITLRDLGKVFDGRPTLNGAFSDEQVKGRGGASFSGKLSGQPITGIVLCAADAEGADISVTYCFETAPAEAWDKLNCVVSAAANTMPVVGRKTAAANVRLRTYTFPDGTGTIGLPAGWKTDAQTVIQAVSIEGPSGQTVLLGCSYSVNTPDSFIVQNQMQLIENARRMGMQPPPPIEMFVAPYTSPVEALWS